jgi:protein-S-isoprenylcysteine O-methyltransferase Ste14
VSAPEAPEVKPPRKAGIPRWAALALAPLVWLVAIPLVHGVVPWAISLLGPWYGWVDGGPAVWNLLGLVLVAAGAVVLLWLMVLGFAHAAEVPERVELNWSPKLLMTWGPYAFSRHPMYLAELALWLGWAASCGSVIVPVGFLLLCLVVSVLAPLEERSLEAKFGDNYREYKSRVPRWLGVPGCRTRRGS